MAFFTFAFLFEPVQAELSDGLKELEAVITDSANQVLGE
jgi:hypothetical protein